METTSPSACLSGAPPGRRTGGRNTEGAPASESGGPPSYMDILVVEGGAGGNVARVRSQQSLSSGEMGRIHRDAAP